MMFAMIFFGQCGLFAKCNQSCKAHNVMRTLKAWGLSSRKLEDSLKAMQTLLPLVSELHHPALRPRHWKQLMKVRILAAFKWHLRGKPYSTVLMAALA
jgi:hypothetical protein